MLSYRHAFHAGNHADILKHLCWLGVIQHLKQKTKPFVLFDTHAGAGEYPLNEDFASQNKEYDTGMTRLLNTQAVSPLLDDYLTLSRPFWQQQIYPGSPRLMAEALREQDHAHVMELHPTEIDNLQRCMRRLHNEAIHVHHRDGLEGLIALTPPNPNRGAVLIDPPYEQKKEYTQVADTAAKVYSRWQNAQMVIWYPLLSGRAEEKAQACQSMLETASQLGKNAFCAELTVAENTHDAGMYGSGVLVINPAWQLDEQLTQAMKEVAGQLGPQADFSLRWLKTESM